jgi:hypothetical protein
MQPKTWRDAIAAIDKAIGPIGTKQKKLAKLAGVSIPTSLPSIVAAARLRLALSEDLYLENLVRPRFSSGRPRFDTIEYIREQWKGSRGIYVEPESQEEGRAWVDYLYLRRRRSALARLRPCEGDVVATPDGTYGLVSSIGENGRLYFKGGHGFGAWPDSVVLVARARDRSTTANEARTTAQNVASKASGSWSTVRHEDLQDFEVIGSVSQADIDEFATVIDSSSDEKPIQKHLEARPQLLSVLLPRPPRYVIPQKRLGSEFVLDFILGDVDSMGIHWYLVELESPRASVYLADQKTLSKEARKGIDQVVEWRNWLQNNVAYARQPRSRDGLGLFDIRPDVRALVLVGRRSTLATTTDAARQEARSSRNIQIHTYDWLLATLRGANEFFGPSGANPYSLARVLA